MLEKCTLKIVLDASVQNNIFFKKIKELEFDKVDIFKYGILNEGVPPKIKEKEFEYLESKIPYLMGLYQDFIELEDNRVINLSNDENAKRISETIGVGLGLLYATKLIEVNPNVIQRIKPAINGKYLDFKIVKEFKEYEIETKGTINHNKKNQILADIVAKKNNTNNTAIKCGVITLANKFNNHTPSKLVVCDDWDEKKVDTSLTIKDYFLYYEFYLSFILDSTFYNRLYRKIESGKINSNLINIKKIPHSYVYDGRKYLGQFFDKRLILQLIMEYYRSDINLEQLFNKLTDDIGVQQLFLGIDEKIIKLLNLKDSVGIKRYTIEKKAIIENEKEFLMCDMDGIIIVASNGSNPQFKSNFTEYEVKMRMQYVMNVITNTPHECGAPCRSREKEGDLCKKMTYREHCHFHR